VPGWARRPDIPYGLKAIKVSEFRREFRFEKDRPRERALAGPTRSARALLGAGRRAPPQARNARTPAKVPNISCRGSIFPRPCLVFSPPKNIGGPQAADGSVHCASK
jgi:hypothetical protein